MRHFCRDRTLVSCHDTRFRTVGLPKWVSVAVAIMVVPVAAYLA